VAKTGKFDVITGMWRRRKSAGGETYYYGKTRSEVTLPAGSEIYLFPSSARNTKNSDPQNFLKVKVPSSDAGDSDED